MKKVVTDGFIWECPLCSRESKRIVRCQFTARCLGVAHLCQMHQRPDLAPIIKKSSALKKQKLKKKPMKTSNEGDVWFEISELSSFNVKAENKLLIPGHIFVTKKIFLKIQKEMV